MSSSNCKLLGTYVKALRTVKKFRKKSFIFIYLFRKNPKPWQKLFAVTPQFKILSAHVATSMRSKLYWLFCFPKPEESWKLRRWICMTHELLEAPELLCHMVDYSMWARGGWGQLGRLLHVWSSKLRVKLWLMHGIPVNTYLCSFVLCWEVVAI